MAIRAEDISPPAGVVDIDRDRLLVVRHQGGDDEAFDELYRRYRERVVQFCQRRVGDRHVAEELAQEAFERAFRAMPGFAGERRFYPWMTVIAGRLCIDHHRRTARVEPAADIDPGVVEADYDELWAAVDHRHVRSAVERLAPRHQEVLDLRERQGLSYKHIAKSLGVPVTTVEALLHRARRALRREYLAVSGDDAGRLAAAGIVAATVARIRAWVAAVGPERLAPALGAAAASVAAVGLVSGPLTPRHPAPDRVESQADTVETVEAVDTGPAAAPVTISDVGPGPAPDGSATLATPAPVTTPTTASRPVAPPPVASAGPVNVYQGPEAADYADDTNVDEPVYAQLGELGSIGADPAALTEYVLRSLLPVEEEPTP